MSYYFYPFILIGIVIFLSAFFIVKQQTATIIERFGRYQSIRQSGLQMKIPLVDRIAGRLTLKIQQLDVLIETKTLDDVFVKLKVSAFVQNLRPNNITWHKVWSKLYTVKTHIQGFTNCFYQQCFC